MTLSTSLPTPTTQCAPHAVCLLLLTFVATLSLQQALAASCTGGATRSASSTISDAWSVFDGCVLSAPSTVFDFGTLPVSTAAPFGLRIAHTTIPIVGGGAVVELRGMATATTHGPLDILIANSTLLNAMLKITLVMPAGSRIAVQNTTFLNNGLYINPGYGDAQYGVYVPTSVVFLGALTLRDGSALVFSNVSAKIIRGGLYNFGSLWTSFVDLKNGSSIAISDNSRWVSDGGGSTWDAYGLRLSLRYHGTGNVFLVSNSYVEAITGGSDGQTSAAISSYLVVGTAPSSSFGLLWNISRSTLFSRGPRIGQTVVIHPASYLSVAVANNTLSGERTLFDGTVLYHYVMHIVSGTFQHSRFSVERCIVTTANPALMTALIMFQTLSLANTTFAFVENTLGTSPAATANAVTVAYSGNTIGATPISITLQDNTIRGNAALALPRIITGYSSPMTFVFCRNRFYGTQLVTRAAHLSSAVTDIGPSNGAAARYWCGSGTLDRTPTASTSTTASISATKKITRPTYSVSAGISSSPPPLPRTGTDSPSRAPAASPSLAVTQSVSGLLSKTLDPPVATTTTTTAASSMATPTTAPASASTPPTPTATDPATPSPTSTATSAFSTTASPLHTTTAPISPPSGSPSTTAGSPTTTGSSPAPPTTSSSSTASGVATVTNQSTALSSTSVSTTSASSIPTTSIPPSSVPTTPPCNGTTSTAAPALTAAASMRLPTDTTAVFTLALQQTSATGPALPITFTLTNGGNLSNVDATCVGTSSSPSSAQLIDATKFSLRCTFAEDSTRGGMQALRHYAAAASQTGGPPAILTANIAAGILWQRDVPIGSDASCNGPHRRLSPAVVLVLTVWDSTVLESGTAGAVAEVVRILLAVDAPAFGLLVVDPTAVEAQLLTVLLLSPCASPSHHDAAIIAQFLLSPIAAAGARIVVAVHTALAVIAIGGHLLLTVYLLRRRWAALDASATASTHFATVLAAARFPGPTFALAMLLYPGAAHGTAILARSGSGADMAIVAAATITFLIPLPALAAALLFRVAVPYAASSFVPAPTSTAEGGFSSPQLRDLRRLWTPIGDWTDGAGLERRGLWSVRGFTAPRGQLQAIAAVLVLLVTCVLAASPKSATCRGRLATASALFAAVALVVAALRPYTTRLSDGLSVGAYLGLCGLAAAIATGTTTDAAPPPQAALLTGLLFAIVTIVCTFARTAHWGHLLFVRMQRPVPHKGLDADENMVALTTPGPE